MKTSVSAPPPRDIAQEAAQTQAAQRAAAGPQFEDYANYAPKYDQVDMQRVANLLGLPESSTLIDINSRLTGAADAQTIASNRALREADLRDAQELGGMASRTSRENNPELYAALERMGLAAGANAGPGAFEQQAGGIAQRGASPFAGSGPLMAELERQAASDLALGGNLSAQETRDVLNPIASKYAASGLGRSNVFAANAALGLDSARRQRQQERRGFATVIDNQGFGQRLGTADFNRTSAAQQFAQLMGLGQAQDARNQAAFGQLAQVAQGRLATYQDPFMAILGRQSSNIGTNAGLLGGAGGIAGANNSIRNNFDPFSAYASDLYNTNYNGEYNARVATANNRAGIIGGVLGGAGSLFGAAGTAGGFGKLFCWVAREVYGAENPEWLDFREHMLTSMPADFVAFYAENGEAIAKEIADKPALKRLIRGLMDAAKGGN